MFLRLIKTRWTVAVCSFLPSSFKDTNTPMDFHCIDFGPAFLIRFEDFSSLSAPLKRSLPNTNVNK